MEEDIDEIRRRLLWRSKRGLLELELFLNKFIESNLNSMIYKDLNDFIELLDYEDPVLFSWLNGSDDSFPSHLQALITNIRNANKRLASSNWLK